MLLFLNLFLKIRLDIFWYITGCQPVSVGYFELEPYVVPEKLPLDGADIRVWNILASKLNLCGTFVKGSDILGTFLMVPIIF